MQDRDGETCPLCSDVHEYVTVAVRSEESSEEGVGTPASLAPAVAAQPPTPASAEQPA